MRLSDSRYENIKINVVNFIEQYGIDTYPLNLEDLCNGLKIPLVKYSKLNDTELEFVNSKTEDAYLVKKKNEPLGIVYNDNSMCDRIPMNFAHELGHIGMGHKVHSALAEAEADFFGVYLLAPNPIIEQYDVQSFEDIYNIFHTSITMSLYAFSRYSKWKQIKSWYGYKDYEQKLLNIIKVYNR